MSAGVKHSTLPENADKILFAEDLVNHIMSKLNLPLLSSGIADHRALIYNAFDSEIRLAVNSVYECYDDDATVAFERFFMKKALNINDFIKYVKYFKSRLGVFVPDFPTARCFLLVCLKLSTIAGKFYMHGILDAPDLAVDHIVSIIQDFDMVEDGGWEALKNISREWSRIYMDVIKICLTPEYDEDSNSSSSFDRESEDGEDPDEDLEESTDEEYRKVFVDSCSSSEEEPFSSSSGSKQIEKTYGVKACNIVTSDNALDSASVGSFKVKTFSHSFQDISKEDDSSIQNVKKDRNEKPSCTYSEGSKFYSKKFKADVQTADDIDPFGRQLTEERSGIFFSPANELYKSDSARHLDISISDNLTAENSNKSSTEDRDKAETSAAETCR